MGIRFVNSPRAIMLEPHKDIETSFILDAFQVLRQEVGELLV